MQDRRTHAKLPIKIMRPYISLISLSQKKNLWHRRRNWIKGPNLIHTTFDIPWTMFFFQLTIHSTDETRNYACLFAWWTWLVVPIASHFAGFITNAAQGGGGWARVAPRAPSHAGSPGSIPGAGTGGHLCSPPTEKKSWADSETCFPHVDLTYASWCSAAQRILVDGEH